VIKLQLLLLFEIEEGTLTQHNAICRYSSYYLELTYLASSDLILNELVVRDSVGKVGTFLEWNTASNRKFKYIFAPLKRM
jgi:hypothetical protein